jgi:hypothetical protein
MPLEYERWHVLEVYVVPTLGTVSMDTVFEKMALMLNSYGLKPGEFIIPPFGLRTPQDDRALSSGEFRFLMLAFGKPEKFERFSVTIKA